MENQKENNSTEKVKKKPFKQTRELVKLALNNGYTQTEIAKLCRTQQSIVSVWSKGEKLGTEQQLKPLLDLFGHKLRRNSFKLYWFKNPETAEIQFMRVEGQVIFSLTIGKTQYDKYNKKIFTPTYKFIIHHQKNENVFLLFQGKVKNYDDKNLENATWETFIKERMTIENLITFFDTLPEHNEFWKKFSSDYQSYMSSLPFLIRQALLNHGLPVKNIIEYPESW